MQLGELFVAAANLGVGRLFRQRAALLLAMQVILAIVVTHAHTPGAVYHDGSESGESDKSLDRNVFHRGQFGLGQAFRLEAFGEFLLACGKLFSERIHIEIGLARLRE
jgi:hypothetical protein